MSVRAETCSAVARAAGVPLAGTASTSLGYVCIEHNGPWGPKILKNVEFGSPGTAAAGLADQLSRSLPVGFTPLLVRRHGSRHGIPSPAVVMIVALTAHSGRGIRRTVDDFNELARMDFRTLVNHVRLGSTPEGWAELGPTYLICAHSKRDQCCAVLGRPMAEALAALRPSDTWEASHVGGHRLAPNLVALPAGVHYGRVEPGAAAEFARAHESGEVVPGFMRGRASLAPAVQAAEIELRTRLRIVAASGLRLVSASSGALTDADSPPDHGPLTTSVWEVSETGERWRVTVVTATPAGPPVPISCGADPVTPPPEQRIRAVVAL